MMRVLVLLSMTFMVLGAATVEAEAAEVAPVHVSTSSGSAGILASN